MRRLYRWALGWILGHYDSTELLDIWRPAYAKRVRRL